MKTKIKPFPENDELSYGHLKPVVDFLLSSGHESAHDFVWGVNKTGYFCHLKNKIDFTALLEKFEFPTSIEIDRKKQTIDCLKTYTLIRGDQ